MCFVVANSFRRACWAQPPFSDLISTADQGLNLVFYFGNYLSLVHNSVYTWAIISSLQLSLACMCFVIPLAFFFAFATLSVDEKYRDSVFVFVMIPMFIPFVVKLYSWLAIFELLACWYSRAFVAKCVAWLFCCSAYLPMTTAMIREDMKKITKDVFDAAGDLGASPWVTLRRVVVPLSLGSIINGAMVVMMLSFGEFVVPELLSGGELFTIGAAANAECFVFHNLPMGSALSVFMLVWSVIPLVICTFVLNKSRIQNCEYSKSDQAR